METISFTPVILFSALAFWRLNPIIFLITAPVAIFTGFHWYDTYVTPEGLAIGLALILYGYVCFGMSFVTLMRRGVT